MKGQTYRGGILSSNGVMIWIDEEDFDRLVGIGWHVGKDGYAIRTTAPHTLMHREILGLEIGGPHVDHVNRIPLDNQRANLRIATRSQNQWNRPSVDGVYMPPRCTKRPWIGRVRMHRKVYYTKPCFTREEAVEARKALKRKLHGEFASR